MPRATTLLLAALAALLLASAPSALAAEQTLSVVGQGSARPVPDVAAVTVALSRTRPGAESARTSVNKRAQRIITAARALEVPRADIQTSEINLARNTLKPLHK